MELNWKDFKLFVINNDLFIQCIENKKKYFLTVVKDGILFYNCNINKYSDPNEDQIDFETNFKHAINKFVNYSTPFSSKKIGTKCLFKRIHGIKKDVEIGFNIVIFTIPYSWIKITGVELIATEINDSVNMIILDSISGKYSGISNFKLNQFGFDVCLSKDFYEYKSEYDADLYLGMQIKFEYNSKSQKTIGINLILNEIKD